MGEMSKECEKTGAETGSCAFCSAHDPLTDYILIFRDYSGCCLVVKDVLEYSLNFWAAGQLILTFCC